MKIDGISLDEALKEIFISGSLGNVFVKLKSFKRNNCRLDVLLRNNRGRHGRDRMVDEFTTTYAISVYHHWCCEFESRWGRGDQHYVIKSVSYLRRPGRWFSSGPPVSSTNKTVCYNVTEILLKVVLNTIKQTRNNMNVSEQGRLSNFTFMHQLN